MAPNVAQSNINAIAAAPVVTIMQDWRPAVALPRNTQTALILLVELIMECVDLSLDLRCALCTGLLAATPRCTMVALDSTVQVQSVSIY